MQLLERLPMAKFHAQLILKIGLNLESRCPWNKDILPPGLFSVFHVSTPLGQKSIHVITSVRIYLFYIKKLPR